MPIFTRINGRYKKLRSILLSQEKQLQTVIEENLNEIFEIYFLETEYSTTFGGRIDTLAIDSAGAPVIIEYKRNRNDNVINQGLSYLKWLQAQKEEFFQMLVSKKLPKDIAEKIVIDWKHPRLICIAESYSKFDIDMVEIVPIRIELYLYRVYEGGILSIIPVNVPEQKEASLPVAINDQPKEQKSLESFLKKGSDKTRELFLELREKIKTLDKNIEENVTLLYVGYRISMNFAEVHIGKGHLKIHMRPIEYVDPKKRVERISDGYQWTMNKRVYLKEKEELEEVMSLIEQSYNDVI